MGIPQDDQSDCSIKIKALKCKPTATLMRMDDKIAIFMHTYTLMKR